MFMLVGVCPRTMIEALRLGTFSCMKYSKIKEVTNSTLICHSVCFPDKAVSKVQ